MESVSALSRLLDETANRAKEDIHGFIAGSSELVVFGSSACGLRTADSDIDVLCVNESGEHIRNSQIDLLCISETQLYSQEWLASELAGHIAAYGVWIKGENGWRDRVRFDQSALSRKRRRVSAYAVALGANWMKLSEPFKWKYSIKLRREIQRKLLLEQGIPIPPTLILDEKWRSAPRHAEVVDFEISKLLCNSEPGFSSEIRERVWITRGWSKYLK